MDRPRTEGNFDKHAALGIPLEQLPVAEDTNTMFFNSRQVHQTVTALAHYGLRTPGWNRELREIAGMFENSELFDDIQGIVTGTGGHAGTPPVGEVSNDSSI